VFDACNIYLPKAWTNANDKITVKDYSAIDSTQHRGGDPSKKVPDLNCEVQDLLLEVVDLK